MTEIIARLVAVRLTVLRTECEAPLCQKLYRNRPPKRLCTLIAGLYCCQRCAKV